MIALRLFLEPPEKAPVEQVITADHAVVGRVTTADVFLDDALVSRQHARFSRRPDGWWIEDLSARNRTFLNNRELSAPAPVHPGDVLLMGHTVVRVLDDPTLDASRVEVISASPGDPFGAGPGSPSTPDSSSSGDGPGDRQAARLSLLNEVHRALATPISLPDLLDLILERCFAVLRPEQGVILLRGAHGDLERAALRQLPGQTAEIVVSRRIVEEVAGKGRSVLVEDATRDKRLAGSESVAASGIRSVVAAPLVDAGGVLGMVALYSRVRVRRFNQQDLEVLESLASVATLRVRNIGLAEEAAARRILDHELALAHEIQMAMLPHEMPQHPEIEVAALLKPARLVGGDLYDVMSHEERLWVIVADVSGKGVAAALFMAVTKTLFRAIVPSAPSLADLAARINHELCRDNDRNMFVTALLACVEPVRGIVSLCDAGHNPPVLSRGNGATSHPALPKRMAFGVAPDNAYVETPVGLGPGDTLVLYTDGITEARATDGTAFGPARLEGALQSRTGQPIQAVIDGLVGDVMHFAAGAPQEDDLAILALRRR